MKRQMMMGALAAAAFAALGAGLASGPASACNRMDGCDHEFQREDYEMMRSGRYEDAIRQGQENIEAFRSMTDGSRPQGPAGRPPPATRSRR